LTADDVSDPLRLMQERRTVIFRQGKPRRMVDSKEAGLQFEHPQADYQPVID
jgi:hypothetical protein